MLQGTLMVGSPQSILCAVGSWNDEFGTRQRSGRCGALCPPVRSEPFPLFPALLSESSADGYCPGPARGQNQETADHVGLLQTDSTLGRIARRRVGAADPPWSFHQPKKLQLAATWRRHERVDHGGRPAPPLGWSPAATAFQQQPEPGSRAVLLGAGPKRGGSCGTGVFLPRQLGRPADLRKKPGGSPPPGPLFLGSHFLIDFSLNYQKVRGRGGSFHSTRIFTAQLFPIVSARKVGRPS